MWFYCTSSPLVSPYSTSFITLSFLISLLDVFEKYFPKCHMTTILKGDKDEGPMHIFDEHVQIMEEDAIIDSREGAGNKDVHNFDNEAAMKGIEFDDSEEDLLMANSNDFNVGDVGPAEALPKKKVVNMKKKSVLAKRPIRLAKKKQKSTSEEVNEAPVIDDDEPTKTKPVNAAVGAPTIAKIASDAIAGPKLVAVAVQTEALSLSTMHNGISEFRGSVCEARF
ncbi:hypothetical protein E2542_SST01866 [Spatholobus suberectus]|nr:hypothetical protein E2542_SST01866 [Spatholobus suberectus]